jgi:hypothetical protein
MISDRSEQQREHAFFGKTVPADQISAKGPRLSGQPARAYSQQRVVTMDRGGEFGMAEGGLQTVGSLPGRVCAHRRENGVILPI